MQKGRKTASCGKWLLRGVLQKKLSLKLLKIHREIPVRQSLSKTVNSLQAVRFATLLKRNPHTGVLEPAVCRSSIKYLFLNNSQNSQETCVRVPL